MQKQVVLSLGSNLGDRRSNIEMAIDAIHLYAGTVIHVSNLYESPAMGFRGEPFYNCAVLIHTIKTAGSILSETRLIEKGMGRDRSKSGIYQSRSIDIDIIAYDHEIISEKELQIPHPRMQERKFVLLPMQDIIPDWRHPLFNQTISSLISSSGDSSDCRKAGLLQMPLHNVPLNKFNYIAVEGNIGAGKTTLVTKIAEDFNAKTVFERFADNPFLPKFYEDQNRFAFPLEMSFLADRYQQISDDLAQFDLFRDFIVADYHIFKSLIFARVTLTDDEYRLYRKLFEIIYGEMPKPDLYIYLYQNTDRLLENIRNRGRDYEQQITGDYLEKINRGYLDYIKSQPGLNVLVIDISEKDFLRKQEDYIFILDEIRKKLF